MAHRPALYGESACHLKYNASNRLRLPNDRGSIPHTGRGGQVQGQDGQDDGSGGGEEPRGTGKRADVSGILEHYPPAGSGLREAEPDK